MSAAKATATSFHRRFDVRSFSITFDVSWIGAIASVASALVVVATAIAAFLQIRHVRNTNEITVYLKLSDRLEALGAPGAFTAIDPFLDRLATDATLRLRLAQPGFVEEFVIIAAVLRVLGQSAT